MRSSKCFATWPCNTWPSKNLDLYSALVPMNYEEFVLTALGANKKYCGKLVVSRTLKILLKMLAEECCFMEVTQCSGVVGICCLQNAQLCYLKSTCSSASLKGIGGKL